jgi:uncharacterized protein
VQDAELSRIYAEADALYDGWSCDASTECCRFAVTGREPYVTSIEIARVRRAVAARGLRVDKLLDRPAKKRPLPLADNTRGRDEGVCPMLDARGRCAVYTDRPFGCRTFFCDRARGPRQVPKAEVVALVGELKSLAATHERGGDVGRPLVKALASG